MDASDPPIEKKNIANVITSPPRVSSSPQIPIKREIDFTHEGNDEKINSISSGADGASEKDFDELIIKFEHK